MSITQSNPELTSLEIYPQQVVDYVAYRDFCSIEDGFHHTGILSEEAYNVAVTDERTIFAQIGGRLLPAVVSLAFEDGYDSQRVKRLSDGREPKLASLPVAYMAQDISPVFVGPELDDNAAIVVEQPGLTVDESVRRKVAEYFSGLGSMATGEFIDRRVKNIEGHATAWLSLYSLSFEASEAARQRPPAADFNEAWQQYCIDNDMDTQPKADATGTYLFTPEQLKERPDIVDGLWEISEAGFGDKLGKYHPVSMEETKQFFADHVLSDDTFTAIHFEDGKPSCFGSLVFDIDSCEWLNLASTSMQQELGAANHEGETPVWFSEIISRGIGQAHNIFQLFLDLGGRTHKSYRLLFESSNFASTYIPDMANAHVEQAERLTMIRPSERLDKMNYWYLKHRD
jgi:hypothetical protein